MRVKTEAVVCGVCLTLAGGVILLNCDWATGAVPTPGQELLARWLLQC